MEYYFIVNPTAGKVNQSKIIAPQIEQAVGKAGITAEQCHIINTEYRGHAKALAREIAKKGEHCRIYSVGGDGTFHEVLNGAYKYKNAAVGCIPCGSGNDFLRSFGEREAFLDLDAQLAGEVLEIDVMKTKNGVSAAICSVGLDAKVAYGIPKFRRIPFCGGSMAYNLSILQCLLGKLGHKLWLDLDGEILHSDFLMVAACNGKCYGGGFFAAPEADLTDGLIDVMMVRKISLLKIARVIGVYQKGKHMKNGEIRPELANVILFRRARNVKITLDNPAETMILNEDGECGPTKILEAKLLPRAARIILPKGVS